MRWLALALVLLSAAASADWPNSDSDWPPSGAPANGGGGGGTCVLDTNCALDTATLG